MSLRLVVETGLAAGSELELLGARSLVIGSSEAADLSLQAPGVAPSHVRLVPQGVRWAAIGLGGSRMAINDRWSKRGSLRQGDRLTVGPIEMTVAGAAAWLEVVDGFLNSGQTFELSRGLTLGRSFTADVTLFDLACSREHCRVELHGDHYRAVDMGSTNGSFHNALRMQPGQAEVLNDGDRLRLGDTLLTFRTHGEPTQEDGTVREAWESMAASALAGRDTERLSRRAALSEAHLSGDLSRMSFPQIVQLLSYAGKSGDLVLDTPEGPAGVSFRRGRVLDAWCPDAESPEESFYSLARAQEGRFRFHQRDRNAPARIRQATLSLLLEAARRADEVA